MTNPTSTPRTPLRYRDFNLRLASHDLDIHTFKVWVEGETPGGSMRPDNAAVCTYTPEAFWDNTDQRVGGLLGRLEHHNLEESDIYRLGGQLADLALPTGPVRDLFERNLIALRDGEGLRLRLRIDSAVLSELPWEYMLLRQAAGEPRHTDFLALRHDVSIVRTDTLEAPDPDFALPNRNRARFVVALSLPEGQDELDLTKDKSAIQQAAATLNEMAGNILDLAWVEKPATREKLMHVLSEGADVFQYSGHAGYLPEEEGVLLLEKPDGKPDHYGSQELAQLLHSAGARLVVLSACETGRRSGKSMWGGLAPAIVRERIPAVIANQFRIDDSSAIIVAANLYPRLLSGFSVDEALFEARQGIYQVKGLQNTDWGVPVLYGRQGTGVLFPIKKAQGSASQGPFGTVANTFDKIAGEASGAVVKRMRGGQISVRDKIGTVEAGGKYYGVYIDDFGV